MALELSVKKILVVLAVLVVLVGIAGAAVYFAVRSSSKTTAVYMQVTEVRDLQEVVKASGEVTARIKVNISSHVIAKIERLFVQEGDEVKAGQPFLELEKESFTAVRDDWASRLELAKNEVEQARIGLADAELRAERARRLAAEGIQAKEQLEAAELALNSARLRLKGAEEQVIQARANLVKAQDDLGKTTLYAPLSGRVVSLQAKEGEVVVSGTMNNPASVIGTIADLSEILAEVDVDETEIVRIASGQPALLTVDAMPDRTFEGKVVEVGSSGYNRAQNPDVTFFRVKILLSAPEPSLRPGMSVRADIRTAERQKVVVVPIQSVVRRPKDGDGSEAGNGRNATAPEVQVVFVVEDGKAKQTPVETGIADETSVEILSGLSAGSTVVTGPYRALKNLKDAEAVRERKVKEGETKEAESERSAT